MENDKNKKSVKFQGDMLNFCDFIQDFVFTRNHHLKDSHPYMSPLTFKILTKNYIPDIIMFYSKVLLSAQFINL